MNVQTRFVSVIVLIAAASGANAATFEELAAQANAAREANRVSEAIQLYQEALQLKPSWQDGWWYLGTLAYDNNRYDIGGRAFREFVNLDNTAAAGWAFLGLCESETGEYSEALEHIRRALEIRQGLEPDTEEALLFHEALLLTRAGLFDQASPRFMPFVKHGLHDATLLAGIGLTALREAMLPKEIPATEREFVAAAGETVYLWMEGDAAKTGPAFKGLLEGYPTARGVHYLYATYLLSFRPAEEAVAELKRELELNPHSADARAMIALLMVRAGAQAAALPLAQQAVHDGPTCSMAQYTYGLILIGNQDLKLGIEYLEKAERLDPANVEFHMGLAGAYSRAGRHADALRERRTSIALAKGSDGPG